MEDARLAVETGVDGVDVVIGTSSFLRDFSHGKDMESITKSAIEVINFVKRYVCLVAQTQLHHLLTRNSKGLEVRFSSEDSFRSDLVDLLTLYKAVDQAGVHRVGIADTVGVASPRQVYDVVRTLRGVISQRTDIETHFHNDTGCAIANAFCALEAGATRECTKLSGSLCANLCCSDVDTSVLGIGERNGITVRLSPPLQRFTNFFKPLGGFLARMTVEDRDYVMSKYKLHKLKDIENMIAEAVQVNIPFNNYVTGFCAFTVSHLSVPR